MTAGTGDDAFRVLAVHRQVWRKKPALRRIYREEFFARLLAHCRPDRLTVEVGSGPGFLKQFCPSVISTDLVECPWLDVIGDAQHLPFESNHVTNIVGLDVLHHIERPLEFLLEATRILAPGGRLVLVEPWITPFSYVVYRYFHQEECELSAPQVRSRATGSGASRKKAFDGNQAIPYLLFGPRALEQTNALLPGLRPLVIEPFCLFAYLLSLGFKRPTLLPEFLYPLVAAVERKTLPLWRPVGALRALLVFEKQGTLAASR